jgi:hypothetical protein
MSLIATKPGQPPIGTTRNSLYLIYADPDSLLRKSYARTAKIPGVLSSSRHRLSSQGRCKQLELTGSLLSGAESTSRHCGQLRYGQNLQRRLCHTYIATCRSLSFLYDL